MFSAVRAAPMADELADLVIRNGMIADGSGGEPFLATCPSRMAPSPPSTRASLRAARTSMRNPYASRRPDDPERPVDALIGQWRHDRGCRQLRGGLGTVPALRS